MSTLLAQTIGDPAWLAQNAPQIKSALPETWTHIKNINALRLSFQFKLLGIDWRSTEEFGKVMAFLLAVGILQRDGLLFRRSP